MKKKLIATLIVLTMLLCIAGCKKSNNNEVPTPTSEVSAPDTGTASDDAKSSDAKNASVNDSGTENAAGTADNSGKDNNTSENNTAENAEAGSNSSDNGTDNGIETPDFVQLMAIEKCFLGTYDDVKHQYQTKTSATEVRLSEQDSEKYPGLAAALYSFSADQIEGAQNEMEFLQETMDELRAEYSDADDSEMYWYPSPWYSYSSIQPVRTDSSVISFLSYNESFNGGAHGYYGVGGLNYDTKTGREIALADVIWPEKFDFVAAYIKERLELNNPEEGYWYDTASVVTSMLDGLLQWTIDYDGITFYWNPYSVASYATGIVQYKILFTETPEIFTGKYITAPKNYMIPINQTYYCNDLDNDGYADYIFVIPSDEDYYGDFNSVRIGVSKLDSKEALSYKVLKDDSIYGYTHDAYFLNTDSGKYIYFFLTQDSDDIALQIYKYTSEGFENVGSALGYSLASTRVYYGDGDYDYDFYDTYYSPDNMILDTRHDVFGTTFEYGAYSVGSDGTPSSNSEFLNMNGYWTTLLQDIEVNRTFADSTDIGEKTVIPAGSKVKFFRTDCNGRVDFTTDDGVCFIMNFESRNVFNDIYVYDLFEFVSFAD